MTLAKTYHASNMMQDICSELFHTVLLQISCSYISAKYYLNWFLFHSVIMKVIGVNFF